MWADRYKKLDISLLDEYAQEYERSKLEFSKWNKNKVHSKETKRRISESLRGHVNFRSS